MFVYKLLYQNIEISRPCKDDKEFVRWLIDAGVLDVQQELPLSQPPEQVTAQGSR